MSIRDNIAYGSDRSSLTLDDIVEAATIANIHSFIQTLPEVSIPYSGRQLHAEMVLKNLYRGPSYLPSVKR